MSIVQDAVSAELDDDGSSPFDWSHTMGVGPNGIILAQGGGYNWGAGSYTGATYGGEAMTLLHLWTGQRLLYMEMARMVSGIP